VLKVLQICYNKKNIKEQQNMEQPKWDEYLLPELKYLSDGKVHKRHEIIDHVVDAMKLTDELKKQTISAGETVYDNRGGWGLTYLKQSGLIESPKRATFVITDLGRELLRTNPSTLVEKDLAKYPKYQEFMERSRPKNEKTDDASVSAASALTPDEMIAQAQAQFRSQACSDLLEKFETWIRMNSKSWLSRFLLPWAMGTEPNKVAFVLAKPATAELMVSLTKISLD
jgi:restriction endonuclease Mrr